MPSHRPGRARPRRTPARRCPLARGSWRAALTLLAASVAAPPLAAQTPDGDDAPTVPDASPFPDVVPTGDWLRVEEMEWNERPLDIHLRTGYERPVILPEPVMLSGEQSLRGGDVTVDVELVLFAPHEHFETQTLVLIGEVSGTRYELAVRSDPIGSRVPLRILRR